jgi:hypothetical protein
MTMEEKLSPLNLSTHTEFFIVAMLFTSRWSSIREQRKYEYYTSNFFKCYLLCDGIATS